MATVISVLLLLMLGAGTVWAQQSSIVFRRIPPESGLSQSSILAITQDRHGFLWVGTSEGLNRYDGYEFVRYRHDPEDPTSLSNHRVLALFEDRAGRLWAGTHNGASRLDERTGRFTRVMSAGESGAVGSVVQIVEDNAGLALYSTSLAWCRLEPDERACRVTTGPVELPRQPALPAGVRAPQAVMEARDGTVWFGTNSLHRYNPSTGVVQRFRLDLTGPSELTTVSALYQDRAGTIWVGTLGGLYSSDPYARHFTHRSHEAHNPDSLGGNLVSAIYEDSSGQLWIGTIGGGLTRVDSRTDRVVRFRHDPRVPATLSSDVVWGIHEDGRGAFWIATDEGINYFDGRSDRFRVIRCPGGGYRDLLRNAVASMTADGRDVVWLGLYGGGLARLDTRAGTCQAVTSYTAPTGSAVVHPDPSGALWVGLEGDGFHRFDRVSRTWRAFPLRVNGEDTQVGRAVWAIHRGHDGILWLGTDIGLWRFDPESGSATRVWDSALPSSVVYAILADSSHRLWLSTNRGICHFDPAAPGHARFACFDAADGLRNTEFIRRAALRARDGRLYFGGLEGLTSFDPERILRTNPIAPPVVLTDVEVRNRAESKNVNPAGLDSITLSHRDYSLSFAFVALSFTNPTRNRYSYMLEGFDPDWVSPSTRRIAQYTNVPPGSYVFRVKGSNNDGVWNEEGVSLRVIVTPPFWQRWWFRTLVAMAFAGALVIIHRYRVRQVLAIERIRQQVATDLHDDVGAGLSQVAILSEVAKRQAPPAAAALMSETAGLARALRESMSDIVWAVDPRKDRLADLVQRMRQTAFNALEADGLIVEFHAPADEEVERIGLTPDRRRQLLLIFKEAITNTARHARASRVRIDLVVQGAELRLVIHDDGLGFEPNAPATGHGLASLSHRASQLGGRLVIDSNPGRGTRIELRAPLR